MNELTVTTTVDANATIVALSGEADVNNVGTLDQKLMIVSAQRPKYVIIDLTQLRFISSICMGSLIRFNHGLERVGGHASVAGAQPLVLEALHRARFDKAFTFHESLDSALRQIAVETA